MTPITVTTWPDEATRTSNSACVWIAEATVEGRTYTARSRHGSSITWPFQIAAIAPDQRLGLEVGVPWFLPACSWCRDTKPTFREAFRQRRCLVPVDNFYEWVRREVVRGDARSPDRRRPAEEATSSAARDAYVEGCEAKLAMYPGTIEAFDRAIAADPDFALGRAHALWSAATAPRATMTTANSPITPPVVGPEDFELLPHALRLLVGVQRNDDH